MTAKAVVTQPERACKHPKLDKKLRCKACGVAVDIREKKNKYGNRRTVVDGITFDSAKESRRYKELCVIRSCGDISSFAMQTGFSLVVNGNHICDYISDFDYWQDGARVVEDAKPRGRGYKKTDAYRLFNLKKKLMKAVFNIDVIEV